MCFFMYIQIVMQTYVCAYIYLSIPEYMYVTNIQLHSDVDGDIDEDSYGGSVGDDDGDSDR